MEISESCLDEERTVTMIEDIVETDETVVNNPQHAYSPEDCAQEHYAPGDCAQEDCVQEDCVPGDCAQEPNNLPPLMESKKVEDDTEVIIKKMKTALDKLTTLDGFEEFASLQSRSCYLVSQEKLVKLVGSTCCEQKDEQKCDAQLSFHSKVVGSSLELTCLAMEESGFQVKLSPLKRGVQLPQMMGYWHLLTLFLVTTTPNLVCYVRLWVCRSSVKPLF